MAELGNYDPQSNSDFMFSTKYSGSVWWRSGVVIHTSMSIMLSLVWTIQLVRTIHAEREAMKVQVGDEIPKSSSINPLQYEEGR